MVSNDIWPVSLEEERNFAGFSPLSGKGSFQLSICDCIWAIPIWQRCVFFLSVKTRCTTLC